MKKSFKGMVTAIAAALLSTAVGGTLLFANVPILAESFSKGSDEEAQLSAPQNLSVDEDGYIHWDDVDKAYGYYLRASLDEKPWEFEIYPETLPGGLAGGVEFDRLCYEYYTNHCWSSEGMPFGDYTVDVLAFDKSQNQSEWSYPITVTYSAGLDTPENVRLLDKEGLTEDDEFYWLDNETIVWDKADNVYQYDIRVYNDDENRSLYRHYSASSNFWEYGWRELPKGDYLFTVRAMDKDYNVSQWTEIKFTSEYEAPEYEDPGRLDTPQNVRFDETGENLLWDEVEGADYYEVYFDVSGTDENEHWFYTPCYKYPEETHLDNWKQFVNAFFEANVNIRVYACSHDSIHRSYSSDVLNTTYTPTLNESIKMPEDIEAEKSGWADHYYLKWETVENARMYYLYIFANNQWLWWCSSDIYPTEEDFQYYGITAYDMPDGTYEAILGVIDQNGNYNKKTYTITIDIEHSDDVWVPSTTFKFNRLIWDYDEIRNDKTQFFWVRITDAKSNNMVCIDKVSRGPYYPQILPNGKYILEVCACVYNSGYVLGNWSEAVEITVFDGNYYDDENEIPTKVEPSEGGENVPEEDRVTDISVNPATNLTDKDGNELDGDFDVEAKDIYEEEELEKAEEALKEELKGGKHFNLLDITFFFNGKDFSNEYIGLVRVTIKLPFGHLDKTFALYRLTEIDGEMVTEEIEGERVGDYYIVYLNHFSKYALVADGGEAGEEHEHIYGDEWNYNEINHWKDCIECDEKAELDKHEYGEWKVTKEATEEEEGSRERECTVCGYNETEIIEKLTHIHTFGEWKSDETDHWKECTGCDDKADLGGHTYGGWKVTEKATEEKEGLKERKCTVCGYRETEIIDKLAHVHSFGEWNCDKTNHWKECKCGEKIESGEHTYTNWTVTKEATEKEEGIIERGCTVCSYRETGSIEKLSSTKPNDNKKPEGNPGTGVTDLWVLTIAIAVCGGAVAVFAKKK